MRYADFRLRQDAGIARFAKRISSSLDRALQVVLPNVCALCGNMSQQPVCAGCDDAYWNEPRLRCNVCAVPLARNRRQHAGASHGMRDAERRCADCVAAPPPFDATFALADYRPPLDRLALGLKFRARLMLATEFGRRLAHRAREAADEPGASALPDLIAPVPLARQRLIERGHNQAWQIAKPLASALRVRGSATLLRRVVDTAPQSRLDLDARRQNVASAFQVAASVQDLHVGIVDDVMTTGATLEAVAIALKHAGARRVTNFVALRTPKN